jgi:membrane protein
MNESASSHEQQSTDPPSAKFVGKQFIKEFKQDEVTELAAAFTYHVVFAIPAMIILTITVAALIDNFTSMQLASELQDLVAERAPGSVQEVLDTVITNAIEQVGGGAITFSLVASALLALWSGSNGVGALMRAFNRAYDLDEDRSFIRKKLVALGLTLFVGIFINVAIVLVVFGGQIGEWVASWVGLSSTFELVWNVARIPIGLILLTFMLAILYYVGPNVEHSFKWISPGAIFTTVAWIAAAFGFRFYLMISSPGSVYGAMSSILVFLFFLYISGIIFISGAEINAIIEKRTDPATLRDIRSKQHIAEERDWMVAQREQQAATRPPRQLRPTPAGSEGGLGKLAVGLLATLGIVTIGVLRRGGGR